MAEFFKHWRKQAQGGKVVKKSRNFFKSCEKKVSELYARLQTYTMTGQMDSRDSVWNSNCNSGSNNTTNSNNNNKSGHKKSSKDRGGGSRKGRRSPTDCYYGGGIGAEVETSSSEPQDVYGTNNNDYSKYSGQQQPFDSDYGSQYGTSARDNYSTSYDANYTGYNGDNRYPVNGDYQMHHQEYSDYDNNRCYGDYNQQEGYGNCSPSGHSDCDPYGNCNPSDFSPSPVQVTAKVLFGSVSAISNLKQKKSSKK
ncbi:hypothetical protein SK128_025039 [Halocaridina rubra]|uniref:Uncharacterized protein n=1 Tax=Halocaridina rubra TaxID=373956 RepID=A0AAN8XF90_HALRR